MTEKKEEKCLEEKMVLMERLKKMAEVDIREVDKDTLVDIKDVMIHTELQDEERTLDYIRQIKNPYCYLCNGVAVKISFAGKEKLEDCLVRCMALQ